MLLPGLLSWLTISAPGSMNDRVLKSINLGAAQGNQTCWGW